MKSLVRDQFKDNMDTVFEHLAGGKTGKVCLFIALNSISLALEVAVYKWHYALFVMQARNIDDNGVIANVPQSFSSETAVSLAGAVMLLLLHIGEQRKTTNKQSPVVKMMTVKKKMRTRGWA